MSKPGLTVDFSQLNELNRQLGTLPDVLDEAVNSTLEQFKDEVRTELYRLIPGVYTIPEKKLKSAFKKSRKRSIRVVSGRRQVSFEVVGKPLSLARFEHTPETPSPKEYPVRARVLKSSSMTALKAPSSHKSRFAIRLYKILGRKNSNLFSPFIASTRAKKATDTPYIIFRRNGAVSKSGRPAIESVSAITVPQMMVHPKVAEPLTGNLAKDMERLVTRQVENHLSLMQEAIEEKKGI